MPPFAGVRQSLGVPKTARPVPVRGFKAIPVHVPDDRFTIVGVTRDAAGAALGNCQVDLFRTADDSRAGVVVSDASGNFIFDASAQLTHYEVGYLPGSPDVFGTTLNTLVGTKHT